MSTKEIISKYVLEPAPLLSILHAVQEENGYLPESELKIISEDLDIPFSELFGTVTFYHYFRLEPEKNDSVYLCKGPVCVNECFSEVCSALEKSGKYVHKISCPGRCDEPIPMFSNGQVFPRVTIDNLKKFAESPSLLPPEIDVEECLFRNIRKPNQRNIENYIKNGGYQSFSLAQDPLKVIQILKDSGLVGRGGAGFPTGVKWEAVRNATGDKKYVICNADEGEPGCFKDRALMDYDPHAVLEGMILAGLVVGAETGIVYLRYEYPATYRILAKAIDEAKKKGFLGNNVASSSRRFEIYLRRGAGAYICGEETSLLNSLEGIRPLPREKPPYPTTHGFMKRPTVINNVETLAAVPPILQKGAQWYRSLGKNGNAGTKIFSLSGDVVRPGNYELPLGTALEELIFKYGNGVRNGRKVKAVTMAGISGGYLSAEQLSIPLDIPSIKMLGSMLGAAGIIVYDDSRCMVQMARSAMDFFADESCGKCYPCRIGTTRITEILDEMRYGQVRSGALTEVEDLGQVMGAASSCGLGLAAPFVSNSFMKYWKDEIDAHISKKTCPVGVCLF